MRANNAPGEYEPNSKAKRRKGLVYWEPREGEAPTLGLPPAPAEPDGRVRQLSRLSRSFARPSNCRPEILQAPVRLELVLRLATTDASAASVDRARRMPFRSLRWTTDTRERAAIDHKKIFARASNCACEIFQKPYDTWLEGFVCGETPVDLPSQPGTGKVFCPPHAGGHTVAKKKKAAKKKTAKRKGAKKKKKK
jgi:hypothetical protein